MSIAKPSKALQSIAKHCKALTQRQEPLPAHTLGSWLPSAPSPKAVKVSDLEQHLVSQQKQKVDELRQRNRELSSRHGEEDLTCMVFRRCLVCLALHCLARLDELLMHQISADHHSEKQKSKYREKSKAQDAKIKSLESALERQRHKVRASEGALQHDRQQLEIDVAVLATELHHAQVQSGAGEDTAGLRLQLAEAQASADEMKRRGGVERDISGSSDAPGRSNMALHEPSKHLDTTKTYHRQMSYNTCAENKEYCMSSHRMVAKSGHA